MPEAPNPHRPRGFSLLTLTPEVPVFSWLAQVGDLVAPWRPEVGALPVVLDLSHTTLHGPGLRALMQELQARDMRVVGLFGLDPAQLGDQAGHLPAVLTPGDAPAPPVPPPRPPPPDPVANSVIIEGNVRSGQRIVNPAGDISVIGAVASGADVVAGGCVHIYGTLRGRAFAGVGGAPAQIFCHRLDAELLAVNGVALTTDDMPAKLLGRPVRAGLQQGQLHIWPLD